MTDSALSPPVRWRAWLADEAPSSQLQASLGDLSRALRRLLANPLAAAGMAIIVLMAIVALAPNFFSFGASPYAQNLSARLQPPSAAHWIGTDDLGRDIYARIVYGARVTLSIVALVGIIVAPIGLAVGTTAGYFGGVVDVILMRITDIFLAFPRLVLALAFVAALGPGIENAIIAISLTAWPAYARIARAETVTIARSDFVAAVVLQGASAPRILFRHIVPLVPVLRDRAADARHGRHHPDGGGPRLPWPGRAAAAGGMGRDGGGRARRHPRPMVGGDHSRPRDLRRQPRLQSDGRRASRRVRSQIVVMSDAPLLAVAGLNVSYPGRNGVTRAVRDVGFTLGRERLGIVGESGSGKSTTGRALLGLIPRPGIVAAQTMTFDGMDLTRLDDAGWQAMRGRRMSMVMQDPKYSLNPVKRIGAQIMETYRLHHRSSERVARQKALDMLAAVQIRDPERVFAAYPHQLSGGMGQRAMIAMMLVGDPDLLVADEPTSALDVTVQNEVLRILDDLVSARGMGLIFISHNLTVVSSFCDRVLVMYAGRIVEECAARDLAHAKHPYTRALIAAAPRLDEPVGDLSTVVRDPAWLA